MSVDWDTVRRNSGGRPGGFDGDDSVVLIPPFDELIAELEIEQLRALYARLRRVHPLVSVALHPGRPENPRQIPINTCIALRSVLDRFPSWVQKLRPRLLDQNEWSNAESAIAEIRACGDLLRAGFAVEVEKGGKSGARPEFHVTADGKVTIVEVWPESWKFENCKAERYAFRLAEP
jgi:hypothetical protein